MGLERSLPLSGYPPCRLDSCFDALIKYICFTLVLLQNLNLHILILNEFINSYLQIPVEKFRIIKYPAFEFSFHNLTNSSYIKVMSEEEEELASSDEEKTHDETELTSTTLDPNQASPISNEGPSNPDYSSLVDSIASRIRFVITSENLTPVPCYNFVDSREPTSFSTLSSRLDPMSPH